MSLFWENKTTHLRTKRARKRTQKFIRSENRPKTSPNTQNRWSRPNPSPKSGLIWNSWPARPKSTKTPTSCTEHSSSNRTTLRSTLRRILSMMSIRITRIWQSIWRILWLRRVSSSVFFPRWARTRPASRRSVRNGGRSRRTLLWLKCSCFLKRSRLRSWSEHSRLYLRLLWVMWRWWGSI